MFWNKRIKKLEDDVDRIFSELHRLSDSCGELWRCLRLVCPHNEDKVYGRYSKYLEKMTYECGACGATLSEDKYDFTPPKVIGKKDKN